MVNFWLLAGLEVARALIPLVIGALLFRKYVAPGINEALEAVQEGVMKITNVAKLSGIKSQEYNDMKSIEKIVGRDLITEKLPELEALKLILSPGAWEQIEETIEENPAAIIQLYEKYGHLLPGNQEKATRFDFE